MNYQPSQKGHFGVHLKCPLFNMAKSLFYSKTTLK